MKQMSSVNAFVISDEDDEVTFARAHEVGLGLDRIDFSINGYPVDEVIFPRVSGTAKRERPLPSRMLRRERKKMSRHGLVHQAGLYWTETRTRRSLHWNFQVRALPVQVAHPLLPSSS